jgi:hypothetical protein
MPEAASGSDHDGMRRSDREAVPDRDTGGSNRSNMNATASPAAAGDEPKRWRPFGPRLLTLAAASAGGAVAIGVMELAADRAAFPLMFVPFATSIVLVMGSPEAEPAQPRALVGGHLVSTIVGLLVLQATGPSAIAAADLRDAPDPHVSPAGGNRSAGRRVQRHALDVSRRSRRRRRADAGAVRLRLAQRLSPRLLAEALVVRRPACQAASFATFTPAPCVTITLLSSFTSA